MPVVFCVSLILQIKTPPPPTILFSVCVYERGRKRKKRFYNYACNEEKNTNKNGFWQNYSNGDCKKFLGHSAVDWDFMNPHAITFTILLSFSRIYSTRIHRGMWARVHNIHMRASTYSNTCLHVHTHFYLNPSCKVEFKTVLCKILLLTPRCSYVF